MAGLSDAMQKASGEGHGAGPADDADREKGPLRRCIATGAVQPKDGMIRFGIAPDGEVVPDLEERLPGRGLWLTADRVALDKAVSKGLFSKAARRAVRPPADLGERISRLLRRRCLDQIGLARRAGQAVAGYEKVREALKGGRVGSKGPPPGLLLEAADGSSDQRGKLTALAPALPVLDLFESAELAAALGRDHAVHAVLAAGRLADGLSRDAARLRGIEASRDAARLKGIDGMTDGTVPADHGKQRI